MRIPNTKFLLLLLLMTILFGFSFIATKIALQELGIFQLIFSRYVIALFFLSLIFWNRLHYFKIYRKDWKHFFLLSLIEPVGYFIFETFGLKFSTPSNVALIIATVPIFSLIFAFWILKEKNSIWGILGIVISFGGVYFIVSFQKVTQLAPNPILGNFLTLGAAISAGLYNVLCRRLSRTYSAVAITYFQTFVGTLMFFPLAFIEGPVKNLNTGVVSSILFLALGCSVAAYLILNYSLSKLPASQVAIFANLIPVITLTASRILFNDILNNSQLLGSVLIVSGVYLTFIKSPPPPIAPPG